VSLAALFVANAAGQRDTLPATAELEARLQAMLAAARAAWPDVALPDETFVRHIAERLPSEGDLTAALEATQASDLFLACACAEGDTSAVAAFERDLMSQVATYLVGQTALPVSHDELKQLLRMRVLVAEPGAKPRIALYTGRGPLGAWLRIAAIRLAIDLRRARTPDAGGHDEALMMSSAVPDPELNYLRNRYNEQFRAAFHETLRKLPARDANVLRLYFLDGVTAEVIGTMYKVSSRTVQRWMIEIRKKIVDETYALLRERLNLSATELGGLLAVVGSQVDVSILRLLDPETPRSE
jgi:RNA polymerase sigma-70 factor (ECF subfamily)